MRSDLAGKTALITGTGAGIGRALAIRFAAEGADIVAVDVDAGGNEETASQARREGGRCEAVTADVTVAAQVEAAVHRTRGIDIIVNNTAIWSGDGLLHEVDESAWDRILDVTLKGVYLVCRAALPGMMARRSGSIINISSINALTGIHLAAYSAAKGGMVSLTKLMALQYGRHGIRTNVICPGTILSESSIAFYTAHPALEKELKQLVPSEVLGRPEDVVECALFLASERAAFINGAVLVADGGASAAHRLMSLYPPV